MSKIEWLSTNQIKVDAPKKCKKITGTRLGAILGQNKWTTPFNSWCAITKTYEEPFIDTIYTRAGKTIEPKQAEYLREKYYLDIIRPEDVYGDDFFNKTYGDFFPDDPIFGGMWDALTKGEDGKADGIIEFKTSSRPQDWEEDVPEYYALQASLYGYLKGVDDVYMVATFLKAKDYEEPEKFKVTNKNTKVVAFKISERYPKFKKIIEQAKEWWATYVESGISPKFDEKADEEILKALKTNSVAPDMGEEDIFEEANRLVKEIEEYKKGIKPQEDRLKVLQEAIKENMSEKFRDGDTKVTAQTNSYVWTLSKTIKKTVDDKALKADGLFDKYAISKETLTLTKKEIKEGE